VRNEGPLDACPLCNGEGRVFYETDLAMVPCPACQPGGDLSE
jgi:hypothetical protein